MYSIKYKRLSPIWKYELLETVDYDIPDHLRLNMPTRKWDMASRIYNCYVDIRSREGKQLALIYPKRIIAKCGYRWDGPTGAIDTDTFMAGSLFHDILCQAISENLIPKSNQKKADKIMRLINKGQNMNPLRRWWTYTAVRWYQSFRHRVHDKEG